MRRLWASLITVFFFTSLILGCAQTRILDELGLVIVLGYDMMKENQILGTFVLHQVDPKAKERVQVISSRAFTSKGVRIVANRETAKKLVSGQLRVAMYSEEIARDNIMELIDTLTRDPEIGNLLYVTVGKGKVYDILSYRYPEVGNVGTYIYDMIEQNVEAEQMVSATLHEFLHDVYSEGRDPLLPYIEKKEDQLLIHGGAAFSKDRMVGILVPNEIFFVKLLRDRYKAGSHEMKLDSEPFKKYSKKQPIKGDKINIVIDTINSDPKIKLMDKNRPEYDIRIKISARLLELSAMLDLSKPEAVKELEKQISLVLKEETEKVLHKLQDMNSDPVGFGEIYRASVRGSKLTRDKWSMMYPKAKMNITVETTLLRTGMIE